MKKIFLTTALMMLVAVTFVSCNKEKVIFEETRTFTEDKWLRQNPESFELDIKNVDDCYNIFFTMTIDTTSVRGNNFPLIVNLFSENGERRMFYSYLILRNNEGTWLAPLEGSKLKINQTIREYFFFNKEGKYRLEIGQGTDRYEVKGISSFGVKIQKAELVYPK